MKDLIIPIVFPDYKITVEIPETNIDIIPWFEFDNITTPASKQRLENLGHAGVLLVDGKSGVTKYYEYGRYDSPGLGVVQSVRLPNAKTDSNGVVINSLTAPLQTISRVAGHGGRIEGVMIEVELGTFFKLNELILIRMSQNTNADRTPYDITENSCIHFVKWVVEAAGQRTPWMFDPRPISYIGEFRDDYPDLDYSPSDKLLQIEGIEEVTP